jgi:uncharacterized protein YndB with AHSA1/START domain
VRRAPPARINNARADRLPRNVTGGAQVDDFIRAAGLGWASMGRTDEASLVIHAPTARVWAALVDPRALEAWLPPTGMTGRVEHFDLRTGGDYRIVLTYRQPGPGKSTADSDVIRGRFVEVVTGDRLVQAVDFLSDDPDLAGTMTMTWSLAARGGATLLTFHADDVPPGIGALDHAQGLTDSLVGLARYLERTR